MGGPRTSLQHAQPDIRLGRGGVRGTMKQKEGRGVVVGRGGGGQEKKKESNGEKREKKTRFNL